MEIRDADGFLVVGSWGRDFIPRMFNEPDEDFLVEAVFDWLDENADLQIYTSIYGIGDFHTVFFGFTVSEVPLSEINHEWLEKINKLGSKFEAITGAKPILAGVCSIDHD